jgi:hypothetical protein
LNCGSVQSKKGSGGKGLAHTTEVLRAIAMAPEGWKGPLTAQVSNMAYAKIRSASILQCN